MRVVSGFHAIEETLRNCSEKNANVRLVYAKIGPRVKKILQLAEEKKIAAMTVSQSALNDLVKDLSVLAQDHRGILLLLENEKQTSQNLVLLDEFLQSNDFLQRQNSFIIILDEITDPHNVGAIFRSCDQFAVDLVIVSERNAVKDGEIVLRASAGASAWIKIAAVNNLNWAVERLKKAGFWVYAADSRGTNLFEAKLQGKLALILGSEGSGVGRLLKASCDGILSIPTQGKIDSLNVSVAAGILLYEINRQNAVSVQEPKTM